MVEIVQILRTSTPNKAPDAGLLIPGALAVEMASNPPRLWVGVPTTIDPSGRRLVGDSGGPYLPLTGGTLAGPGNLTIGGSLSVASTGGFFTGYSPAPNITRLSDRVFIGPTANLNNGSETWPTTSWITTIANTAYQYLNNSAMQCISWKAPTSSDSRTNGMMGLFAARTSDVHDMAGCCSIALSAFGVNDKSMDFSTYQPSWIYYGTGIRMPGCGQVTNEFDVCNAGDRWPWTPYSSDGRGITCTLQLGAGGEAAQAAVPPITIAPTSMAIYIVGNGAQFDRGIVFGGRPAGMLGATDPGTIALTPESRAICFYDGCRIEWYAADTEPYTHLEAYSATEMIHVGGRGFYVDRASSSQTYDSSQLVLSRSRGTINPPARAAVLSGDWLGAIEFDGHTSPTANINSAGIVVSATQNFSSTGSGSQIEFYVTSNDQTAQQLAMTIANNRSVSVVGDIVGSFISARNNLSCTEDLYVGRNASITGLLTIRNSTSLQLDMQSAPGNYTTALLTSYLGGVAPTLETSPGPSLLMRLIGGTPAAPTATPIGGIIGQWAMSGWTTVVAPDASVVLEGVATENWGAGQGAELRILTKGKGSVAALTEVRMYVRQGVVIGNVPDWTISEPDDDPGWSNLLVKGNITAHGVLTAQNVNAQYVNAVHNLSCGEDLHVSRDGNIAGNLLVVGNVTAANFPSERQFKDDITEYSRGLAAICALEPVSWTWNGRGGLVDKRAQYGVIAEDTETVLPEAIGLRKMMLDGGETQVRTLDDKPILYAIVNAVKELATELEVLKKRL